MEISLILVLFIVVAIATGSGFNTLAQGHSADYEPQGSNRSINGLGYYFYTEPGLRSAAIPTSAGRNFQSGNGGNQRILTEESEYVSLNAKSPEDPDEDLVQRHVALVIAVPSVRPDRRKAIRETWMKLADDRVVLRFFSEPSNQAVRGKNAREVAKMLAEESLTYGDIVLQDIDPGMNFGLKLLWAMRWMSSHYSFDFFLRLNDDYFLCLDRLLKELDCLLLPGKQRYPIFAGYRVCGYRNHEAAFADEAYILMSSSIVIRVLATSDLKCSGFGSLTASAWIRVGGPGNPEGDVAFVHDYRLDHFGAWWERTRNAKAIRPNYSPVCERSLGIHRTYPGGMHKLWMEVYGRTNVSRSTVDCTSIFRYDDDGECPFVSRAVDDAYLEEDSVQPCESFTPKRKKMWCGQQNC